MSSAVTEQVYVLDLVVRAGTGKMRNSLCLQGVYSRGAPNVQERQTTTGVAKISPAVERMGLVFLLDMGGLSLAFVKQDLCSLW